MTELYLARLDGLIVSTRVPASRVRIIWQWPGAKPWERLPVAAQLSVVEVGRFRALPTPAVIRVGHDLFESAVELAAAPVQGEPS